MYRIHQKGWFKISVLFEFLLTCRASLDDAHELVQPHLICYEIYRRIVVFLKAFCYIS